MKTLFQKCSSTNQVSKISNVVQDFDSFEKNFGKDRDIQIFPYRYPVETINRLVKLGNYSPLASGHIEITTRCNLKCPGCFRTGNEYESKNRDMNLGEFRKIIDSIPPILSIGLQGIGEPTMNKDLPEMISYARKKLDSRITIITNALARDINYFEKLFSAGLDHMTVSIDSLQQKTIDQLRTGTNITRLTDRVIKLCNKYPRQISFITVVSKTNSKEIESIVRNFIGLGLSEKILSHQLQPLIDPKNETGAVMSKSEQLTFYETTRESIRNNYKKSNYPLKLHNYFIKPNIPCVQAFTTFYATVDGYLTPCCGIVDKNDFNFGNILDTKFEDLYLSKEFTSFKENILQGKYHEACKGCPANISESQ